MLKFVTLFSLIAAFSAQAEVVTLKFTAMNGQKGQLAVAAFNDPDAFPDRSEQAVATFFPLKGGESETTVTLNLKPGRYALATYLDMNMNKKLDKNLLGIPKERFGFSQNPRVTVSAPNFAECEFEVVKGKAKTLTIKLIKIL